MKKLIRYHNKPSRLRSLLLLHLVLFTLFQGCQPSQQHADIDSAATNSTDKDTLASLLGLAEVSAVQILKLDDNSGEWSQEIASITDAGQINEVVATLEEAPSFIPRLRCIAQYRLIFQQPDAAAVQLDYSCDGDDAHFLRGAQEFWDSQDADAPEAFVAWMETLLAE